MNALSAAPARRLPHALGVLVVTVFAAACGGGGGSSSPSGVDAPGTAARLTVVSAEDGSPVAGAAVTVDGQPYTADAAGSVALARPASTGVAVEVVAPGFLDRHTSVRAGETRLSLWPRRGASGLDEDFTAAIVYTGSEPGAVRGAEPLLRLADQVTQVAIVPSAGLQADAQAMAAHAAAAAALTGALGGRIRYTVAPSAPAGAMAVQTEVAPADPRCDGTLLGLAVFFYQVNEINRATVSFCSAAAARSVAAVTHELGHTFGLRHSPQRGEVMYATLDGRTRETLSAREAVIMNLMLARRGGNRFPDDDRGLAARAAGGRVELACPR